MEGNIFKERGELIRGKTGRENTDRRGYKTKDPSTPYPVSTMTISRWLGMSKSRTNFRYFLLILPQSPIIISSRASPNGGCFYTSVDFSSKTLCKLFKPPKILWQGVSQICYPLQEEPSPLFVPNFTRPGFS